MYLNRHYTYQRSKFYFNKKYDSWVEPHRHNWKYDLTDKDLEKQLLKILNPTLYEEKYGETDRRIDGWIEQEKQTGKQLEGKIKAVKAAIYKAVHKIKKLGLTTNNLGEYYKQVLNQKLNQVLRFSNYHRLSGIQKIQFLRKRLTDYKQIIKTVIMRIRKVKPTKTTNLKIQTKIKEKEEEKRMSIYFQPIYRRSQSSYKGKEVYFGNKKYHQPIIKKMTLNETLNLLSKYEKDRETEIREEIAVLKEFGFTKEEIIHAF